MECLILTFDFLSLNWDYWYLNSIGIAVLCGLRCRLIIHKGDLLDS